MTHIWVNKRKLYYNCTKSTWAEALKEAKKQKRTTGARYFIKKIGTLFNRKYQLYTTKK